jgi:hypothetical protein
MNKGPPRGLPDRFCTACGRRQEYGTAYCAACGNPLPTPDQKTDEVTRDPSGRAEQAEFAPADQEKPDARQVPPTTQSTPSRAFIGAMALLVIAILAVTALIVTISRQQPGTSISQRVEPQPAPAPLVIPVQPQPLPPTVVVPAQPQPSSPPYPVAGTPAQAIADYFALVPYNSEAAWQRLTPRFQVDPSGGWDQYRSFWGQFQRVDVSDITDLGNGTVSARVRYVYRNGKTAGPEYNTYTLVPQNGQWKIDSSS